MLDSIFEIHKHSVEQVPLSYRRYLYSKVAWESQAICITGARGVGKTTLLLQYYHEKFRNNVEECLYLSCDNVQVISLGLFSIVQEYFKYGGKALILDEIHKYPNWSVEVKNILDTYKNKQILLSGSSSVLLKQGMADLSRRIVSYSLKGLSFREYLNFSLQKQWEPIFLADLLKHHIRYANQIGEDISVLKYFNEYLQTGYYPYFFEGRETYVMKLLNCLEKVISEDIPAIFNVSQTKIPVLKKMLWLVATAQPFTPNIESMARDLGLSKEYVYYFLDYLEKAGLLLLLKEVGRASKLIRKPAKIFLENPNLIEAVSGSLKLVSSVGTIRETFFVNQLQHLSIHTLKEADFLIDRKYKIEIGGKDKKSPREDKNIILALDGIEVGFGNKIPLYLFGCLY